MLPAESSPSGHPTTRRSFPLYRVLLIVVAVALLGCSIHWLPVFVRLYRGLRYAEEAKLGQISVDLSRPGQYRVKADREFPSAHGMSLVLSVPPSGADGPTTRPVLSGIRAQAWFEDESDGGKSQAKDLEPAYFRREGDETYLHGFGGGPEHFQFVLDIQQGDPALAGRPQYLYCRYGLCGLESLQVMVSGGIALGSGLIGLAIMHGVVWYTLRRRRPDLIR